MNRSRYIIYEVISNCSYGRKGEKVAYDSKERRFDHYWFNLNSKAFGEGFFPSKDLVRRIA